MKKSVRNYLWEKVKSLKMTRMCTSCKAVVECKATLYSGPDKQHSPTCASQRANILVFSHKTLIRHLQLFVTSKEYFHPKVQ